MFCNKCGKEIREGAKFCNYCGAPQNSSQQKNSAGSSDNKKVSQQPRRPVQNRAAGAAPSGNASGGASGGGTGLTLAAKIIIPIAIAVVAAAGIFAAVTFHGQREETAVVSEKSGDNDKDGNENKKTDSGKTEKEEVQEASVSSGSEESSSVSEESSSESEVSGGDITEEEAARQIIAALKRPSFFDSVSGNYVLTEEPSVPEYTVESGLSNVVNAKYFYLTDEMTSALEEYGFVVDASYGSKEFFSEYEENRYNLLPNFVTVDSMMHSYHLYFSYLLRTTEKNYLKDMMGELSSFMFEKSKAQLEELQGTEWEDAARINTAFFAVGCRLTGAEAEIPDDIASVAEDEISLVMAADTLTDSPLFGGMEDYSQYAPRGYYEGDDNLEAYFRTMMWYGRRNFAQKDETLDRSALLMTLAMDEEAFPLWEKAYLITSFFAGASDDNGYYEYRPVIDEFFGSDVTAADLAGAEDEWKAYHEYTAAMKAPQINSVPVMDTGTETDNLAENAGFRFMGQRFSLDAAIFQNLMYNKIEPASDGDQRMLPNALDIPAVMGSDEALDILVELGEDKYPNYLEKVDELRSGMEVAPEAIWSASLYSRWLYTLKPLLEEKGEGWPMFMQSSLWLRKNLQTFLGSYTELKHDTVLYAKQAMAEMGGDNIEKKDDRGYVEPEPEVYARLSALTEATITGLSDYGILESADQENLEKLKTLADQLTVISEKELRNETLSDSEYDLIRTYGGQLEHFWQEAYKDETDNPNTFEYPAAIVTDVATDPNGSCLELGTGNAMTLYAVVPVDGELKLASGTVFSFYQFEQPISERLTDTSWRMMMGIYYDSSNPNQADPKDLEDWTSQFMLKRS